MEEVTIHQAKTHFSRLVARAAAGEEIIVRRGSTPVAKIVGYHPPRAPREPGGLEGQIVIGEDFESLPPEFDEYAE